MRKKATQLATSWKWGLKGVKGVEEEMAFRTWDARGREAQELLSEPCLIPTPSPAGSDLQGQDTDPFISECGVAAIAVSMLRPR